MCEEKELTVQQLEAAIRRSTIALKISPVFFGSAIKNTDVQPMLNGVHAYLPNPAECKVVPHDTSLPVSATPVSLLPAAEAPLVALAFKLEESTFRQLEVVRVGEVL
jgi:elongation factor G